MIIDHPSYFHVDQPDGGQSGLRRRRREDEFVRLRREFRREVKKAQRKYEERVLHTRASEGVPWKMLKELYPGLRKKRRIGHALDSREAKNQAQELSNTYATLMTTRAKVHRRGLCAVGGREGKYAH